ncbi:MAG: hypothetical protein JSR58_05295 [Verrucomicrobia bacterium]|nr:hypothetical protein [Verrucomicrobiota bacterium]
MKIFGFNLPNIPNPFAATTPLGAPAQQSEKAFNEFIRRVSPQEKKHIETKLSKIIHSSSFNDDVHALKAALNTQNWDAPVFHKADYPYLALAALHEGQITPEALATILIFYSAQTETKNIRSVPLFIQGKVNEEAKKLLIETWPPDQQTEEHLTAFFKKMETADPVQQQFFLIPYSQEKEYAGGNADLMTFAGDIHSERVGFNVFGACSEDRHMLPSMGMMQAFLDVCHGNQAVKINPVLGLSSEKDIHDNGLNNERDMGLLFPYINFPLSADGSSAKGFRFWYHDFYHSSLCSLIPPEHRKLYVQFADIILSHEPTNKQLKDSWNAFVDMEMTEYRPKTGEIMYTKDNDLIDAFWIAASRKLSFDKRDHAANIPPEVFAKAKEGRSENDPFIQRGLIILQKIEIL